MRAIAIFTAAALLMHQTGCMDADSASSDESHFESLDCQSTGEVAGYSWNVGQPDLLEGKSILELYELEMSEIEIDLTDPCKYLKLYDYPGSRAAVEKNYTYTYARTVSRQVREGAGINMVGLEPPSEGEWGTFLKDEYFSVVADAGFSMVRIPCRFSAFIKSTNPVSINDTFVTRVEHAITVALEHNLTVLLEVHFFPDKDIVRQFRDEKEKQNILNQLYELWDVLAERYIHFSDKLYFELMNEPRLPLTVEIWDEAARELILRIRATGGQNASRKIVVSPAGWSHVGMLESFKLPFTVEEDPNLIATFHYYEPYSFTFQGLSWGPLAMFGSAWEGNVWTGTEYQKELIRNDLDLAVQWAQTNNRQILLTETGVIQKADKRSRVAYIQFVREEAEKRGIPWFIWSSNETDPFGIYSAEQGWQTEMLNALIPK